MSTVLNCWVYVEERYEGLQYLVFVVDCFFSIIAVKLGYMAYHLLAVQLQADDSVGDVGPTDCFEYVAHIL
jgi:hypothetical protein